MCTSCRNSITQKIQLTVTKIASWLLNDQRLHHANLIAQKQDVELDNTAEQRLTICSTCSNKKESTIVDTANNIVLPETTAERFDQYLNYQCGLCGCSCVLLAYDHLGEACGVWKEKTPSI